MCVYVGECVCMGVFECVCMRYVCMTVCVWVYVRCVYVSVCVRYVCVCVLRKPGVGDQITEPQEQRKSVQTPQPRPWGGPG